jgi:hypothetical protein
MSQCERPYDCLEATDGCGCENVRDVKRFFRHRSVRLPWRAFL